MQRASSIPGTSDNPVAWHTLPAEAALQRLQSGLDGLHPAEAARRLAVHGPNRLPSAPPVSAWRRFLRQFHNLLIYALLVAAVIAGLLGHMVDAIVILAVVVLNAVIGFVQEGRAERALDAIRTMLLPRASVMRDAHRTTVPAEDLVPGDLVVLEPGDRVSADLRLVRTRNLQVQEAVLTGESVPVTKALAPVAADAPIGDRSAMAYSGTLVTAGNGLGVVIGTGADTELGRISALLKTIEPMTTPLLRKINRFGSYLTLVIAGLSVVMFAFAVLARDYSLADGFMVVVGMAVAAIPEGLPAVLTITLAIGVQRMAGRNAIVRRLPAVETLGSVSIICSDKTGTLTRNEMVVRSVASAGSLFAVDGAGYEPVGAVRPGADGNDPAEDAALSELVRAAALCNDAALSMSDSGWVVDGDPMEGALVSLAIKAGEEPEQLRKQLPRIDEIPFDAQHRFMATLHHSHEGTAVLYVKGAPEQVLAMCIGQRGKVTDEPLDAAAWEQAVEALASEGQRVLALASRPMPADARELRFSDVEDGLVLLGLVGLIDPPRDEAIAAVADCRSAGIRVKMITGDHAATARAIARQLGLDNCDDVATGQELDAMDPETLQRVAIATDVFARTSPENKLRLVQALRASGAVIAMTGDGVNDAPALKQADVGVAMGRKGTEAAKEAAEMVLADDNFASIAAAVREGRTVYDNIKKVISWTLPTNGGEALCIIGAVLFGLLLPMTPVQILWINMVTAVGLGLTLAFEPTEPNAMRRPPRPASEALLSGFLVWRIVLVSLLFVAGAFGMFTWTLDRGLTLEEARTNVVNTIVVMEIFYLFSVRYLGGTSLSWRGVLGTPAVLIGVGLVVVLQLAFTYLPFMNSLFATRPVALVDGLAVLAAGVALLGVLELEKLLRRQIGTRSLG
ncbi:MAG: cation-transporting P-type ATPase [Alphaproteobacteria bacterium]